MSQIIIIISSSSSSSITVMTSVSVAQRRIADAYLMSSSNTFIALTRSYLEIRRLTTAHTEHSP